MDAAPELNRPGGKLGGMTAPEVRHSFLTRIYAYVDIPVAWCISLSGGAFGISCLNDQPALHSCLSSCITLKVGAGHHWIMHVASS